MQHDLLCRHMAWILESSCFHTIIDITLARLPLVCVWECIIPLLVIPAIFSHFTLTCLSIDPSITENKDIICAIMMKVGDWDNVGYHLNIPNSRRIFIREQFSAEEERKAALARYWVEASPWASWFTLAKKLYHCEQQEAVEATRKFLPSDVGMCIVPRAYETTRGHAYTQLARPQSWMLLEV